MERDLTKGDPLKLILALAVPQILSAILQLLYNTVDALIVGNYVGEAGLAGVGISMPIIFFLSSVVIGTAAGLSIIVSQYFGAKDYKNMKDSIGTSIVSLAFITIAVTLIGIFGTDIILRAMHTPAEAFDHASGYLKIYFAGTVFTLMFNLYSAILRAVGDTKSPLLFLAISAGLNIILDLVFIINFSMGTRGAALATIISQGFSSLFCLIYIKHKLPLLHLERQHYKYRHKKFKMVLRYGLPSAFQMSVIAIGNILVQSLINGYGVYSAAGYSSAIRIDSFIVLPYMNVGVALSNYSGQNIGAKEYKRVGQGLSVAARLLVLISAITLPIVWIFAEELIAIFIKTQTGESIRIGARMLRDLVPFYIFLGFLNNISGLLRGAGDNMHSLYGSLVSIGSRVIFAYSLNPILGISSVWYGSAIGWVLGAAYVFGRYKSGKWKTKGIIV
ncbi:MAG: MATE family efflux transporter [Bacillota bacterium]|nr:MATE family efflux transporter [Bacillota bacterium]